MRVLEVNRRRFGEGQAAFVPANVDGLDKAFIAEVAERIVACVEVLFGHDSERANGGQSASVLAIQLVRTVAIDNELAFVRPSLARSSRRLGCP